MMLELSIVAAALIVAVAHVLAAKVRARGAVDAAKASAPVFAAHNGGIVTVTIQDPNAKIGGAS